MRAANLLPKGEPNDVFGFGGQEIVPCRRVKSEKWQR
jgi:hypothetical protein